MADRDLIARLLWEHLRLDAENVPQRRLEAFCDALSATPAKADERGSAEPWTERTVQRHAWVGHVDNDQKHCAKCGQLRAHANHTAPARDGSEPQLPPLTDEMRAVIANEGCVYQNADELYEALCLAANLEQRAEPQGLKTWGGEPMSSPIEDHHEALLHAGAMLSNCAFNLAQRTPGIALTADDISALNYSRKAWDAARASAAKEKP